MLKLKVLAQEVLDRFTVLPAAIALAGPRPWTCGLQRALSLRIVLCR